MGTWAKILIGMSPILALLLYVVMLKQSEAEAQLKERHIETVMQVNTFNRDFELQLSEQADNEEDKRLHKVFAENHIAKNEKIEAEREAAKKRREALERKSAENLSSLESELNSLGGGVNQDKDLEFNDNDFNF
jgi:hypothetical protein